MDKWEKLKEFVDKELGILYNSEPNDINTGRAMALEQICCLMGSYEAIDFKPQEPKRVFLEFGKWYRADFKEGAQIIVGKDVYQRQMTLFTMLDTENVHFRISSKNVFLPMKDLKMPFEDFFQLIKPESVVGV